MYYIMHTTRVGVRIILASIITSSYIYIYIMHSTTNNLVVCILWILYA